LKNLADDLVGSDKQDHLPLRPIPDPFHLAENDLDKNELPNKPKCFNDHPEDEVQLEAHLAD
jgi:hypothetical protein